MIKSVLRGLAAAALAATSLVVIPSPAQAAESARLGVAVGCTDTVVEWEVAP
ncbi:hypothetical protein ACFXAZ_26105 [Streptomyces sp. NPDC059477]|uniref:hypothetical protein n=1 Tax=Streptomyces sp. NPDC059477 TaxID=3346847 RepID=UPI0036B380A9